MTTEEIHNFYINSEDIKIVKILLTLAHSSIPMETQPRNPEKAETQECSDGRIKKDHHQHRCVIRDQAKSSTPSSSQLLSMDMKIE